MVQYLQFRILEFPLKIKKTHQPQGFSRFLGTYVSCFTSEVITPVINWRSPYILLPDSKWDVQKIWSSLFITFYLSYQCLPLNPSIWFFSQENVSPRLSSDLSPRRCCWRGEPSDHQKHGDFIDFPCRKWFFSWPMAKGQTHFLPDLKTGSPRIEKLVSNYKKYWIWGGCIYVYLRAKIEKEKLACVDMNMVWYVYGPWFPHTKELINGPSWCVTSTVDQGELVSKFSTGWG